MNRREFLQTTGLLLISGKFVYDSLIQLDKQEKRRKIFNELSDYVYMAEHIGINKDGKETKQEGVGFFVNNEFYSCAHISNLVNETRFQTPFGIISQKNDSLKQICKVKNKELEILVQDIDQDVFIADGSPYSKEYFKEFPCKPSKDRKLGDRVFIIGNPALTGRNVRNGIISDLKDFGEYELAKDCFGTNIYVIGGDSASPLVNEDFELIGLAKLHVEGLSYFIPIEKFTEYKPIKRAKINDKKD